MEWNQSNIPNVKKMKQIQKEILHVSDAFFYPDIFALKEAGDKVISFLADKYKPNTQRTYLTILAKIHPMYKDRLTILNKAYVIAKNKEKTTIGNPAEYSELTKRIDFTINNPRALLGLRIMCALLKYDLDVSLLQMIQTRLRPGHPNYYDGKIWNLDNQTKVYPPAEFNILLSDREYLVEDSTGKPYKQIQSISKSFQTLFKNGFVKTKTIFKNPPTKSESPKPKKVLKLKTKNQNAESEIAKTEIAKTEISKTEIVKPKKVLKLKSKNQNAKTEIAKNEIVKPKKVLKLKSKNQNAKTEIAKNEIAKPKKVLKLKSKNQNAKNEIAKTEIAKPKKVLKLKTKNQKSELKSKPWTDYNDPLILPESNITHMTKVKSLTSFLTGKEDRFYYTAFESLEAVDRIRTFLESPQKDKQNKTYTFETRKNYINSLCKYLSMTPDFNVAIYDKYSAYQRELKLQTICRERPKVVEFTTLIPALTKIVKTESLVPGFRIICSMILNNINLVEDADNDATPGVLRMSDLKFTRLQDDGEHSYMDLNGKVLHIKSKYTKNKEARSIALPEKFIADIKQIFPDKLPEWLLINKSGERYDKLSSLSNMFQKYLNVKFIDVRASYTTYRHSTANASTVGELTTLCHNMGHSMRTAQSEYVRDN